MERMVWRSPATAAFATLLILSSSVSGSEARTIPLLVLRH